MEVFEEIEEESCTDKCRSIRHGAEVCAVGTRGSDREIVTLWKIVCHNFAHVKDSFGRTALHIAASYGKLKAVEWLIKHEGSSLTAKDSFNGYTPLHRSIYFGQLHVARKLISLGASLSAQDNEALSPLDLAMKDRSLYLYPEETDFDSPTHFGREGTDLLVWGKNVNYNLGTGNQSERHSPELLEIKESGSLYQRPKTVLKAVLQNFHSVFVTDNHEVFTCGMGKGGRLGSGTEETWMVPQMVPKFVDSKAGHCVDVVAGSDHTLFLTSSGRVYSCGVNEKFVLGMHPPPEKLLKPKLITALVPITDEVFAWSDDGNMTLAKFGVCCSDVHSVFFLEDRLFTWGLNEGQLGHCLEYGTAVILPKAVHYLAPGKKDSCSSVQLMCCNNLATVFRTDDRIFVLYKNECRQIRFGRMESIRGRKQSRHSRMDSVEQMGVVGGIKNSSTRIRDGKTKDEEGDTSHKYSDTPLALVILTQIGRLFIWREKTVGRTTGPHERWYEGTLTRVFFSIGRPLKVATFCVNISSILIVAADGSAHRSEWTSGAPPHLIPQVKALSGAAEDPEGAFRVSVNSRQGGASDISMNAAPMEQLKLRRIPNVYNAYTVSSDPKGNNYAIFQKSHTEDVKDYFPSENQQDVILTTANRKFGLCDEWAVELDSLGRIPSCSSTKLNEDLEMLLAEADCGDTFHDVEFEVLFNTIPAHRYVICANCPVLYRLIEKASLPGVLPVRVKIESCDVFTFRQILEFIYTDSCDLIERVKKNPHPPTTSDTFKALAVAAKRFKLADLVFRLSMIEVVEGDVIRIKIPELADRGGLVPFLLFPSFPKSFDAFAHEELTDITLVSQDGTEFRAHICILVSRMEYFRSMFSTHFWTESELRRMIMPLQPETLKLLLEYVYELHIDYMSVMFDLEGQLDVLRAADQYLLPGLVREIETYIAQWVTFKNVVEIYKIAAMFNAFQLKEYCLRLMCTNLAMFLENRLFDPLSEDEMAEVTDHYRKTQPRINSYRVLTPDSNAPDHAVYDKAAKLPNPDFDDFVSGGDFELVQKKKGGKQHKGKTRNRGASETELNAGFLENISSEFDVKGSADPNAAAAKDKKYDGGWTKIEAPRRKSSFRKSFSEEEKKTSTVGNPQASESPSGPTQAAHGSKKPSPPVPVQPKAPASIIMPPKLEAMKKQNEEMRALEVKFESTLEFPCLGEIPMIPMPSMLLYAKDPDQVPSPAPPKGKKKTKWVSVPMTGPGLNSPAAAATATNGSFAGAVGGSSSMAQIASPITSPWKMPLPSKNPVTPKVVQLDDIIKEETQKNENFQRAMQKPLASLQIEDEAVDQITAVYSTEEIREGAERLKVERVGSQEFANPTWVARAKNTPAATMRSGKKGSSGRS